MLCPHLLPPNGKQHTYSKETIPLAIAERADNSKRRKDTVMMKALLMLLLVLLLLVVMTCSSTRHMRGLEVTLQMILLVV
jgi:hypothetical protein